MHFEPPPIQPRRSYLGMMLAIMACVAILALSALSIYQRLNPPPPPPDEVAEFLAAQSRQRDESGSWGIATTAPLPVSNGGVGIMCTTGTVTTATPTGAVEWRVY